MLGWKIIKVWALDWWESPAKEGARILARIEQIKSLPEEVKVIEEEIEIEDSILGNDMPNNQANLEEDSHLATQVYHKAQLEKTFVANSDEFLSYSYTQRQIKQIQEIVETEGPILKNLLGKRLLDAWGIGRMGGRLQRRFDELLDLAELNQNKESNQDLCFWRTEQSPEEYSDYRIFAPDQSKRSIEEIPEKELINGMTHVLRQLISLPEEDLIREGAKEFGFARTGNQVKDRLSQCIKLLLSKNIAVESDGKIKLK